MITVIDALNCYIQNNVLLRRMKNHFIFRYTMINYKYSFFPATL